MELEDQILDTFQPKDREDWRAWLQEFHKTKPSIWLIYSKKASKIESIKYQEAVEEALCFGWIDSKSKPIDEFTYMQFFTKRKAKSVWSRINKNKIEELIANGQMNEAGFESIKIAKINGSWTSIDDAEALIIPQDLKTEFQKHPTAENYFMGLSRSDKRNILMWLILAKRIETRQKRIMEIIEPALARQKPKQFGGKSE
jgi:uncharacterized protein YdeI (YjbR/CyaY-like superfamily)